MSASLYAMSICLPLLAVIIVFAIKYWAAVEQARAHRANDAAYSHMAERATTAQSETATALTALQAAMSDVRNRLAAVEKILQTVE